MHEEEEIIKRFYTCFKKLDWQGMIACYSGDIFFYDPVFGNLEGDQVRAMWEMLLSNARDLQFEFSDIVAAGDGYVSCHWIARYTFSATGRHVVNKAKALFKIAGGQITEHQDVFNLWKWSSQALGLSGLLFGWTPPLQDKIRKMAKKNLQKFLLSHPPSHNANPDDHVQSP